jgi:tetratricopeptide (TPR) repeat protein
MFGAPALLLVLLELILRWSGYGYHTHFFQAHADPGYLTTNPRFAWQFYSPQTATTPTALHFPAAKAPGTRRIILLGESAAAGTPDPAFGFARVLEGLLRDRYPSNRFEVINAAMRGINSHIILPIARDCAKLSPDLFLVYMGNNELIGLHAPSPEEINFTAHLWLLRWGQRVRSTRVAQLVEGGMRRWSGSPEKTAQDMDYLRRQRLAFDDPRRDAVYANFHANLADLCDVAHRSGASVLLSSVAVNLHDFPPLQSLHRRDLRPEQLAEWEKTYATGVTAETGGEFTAALAAYETCARIDDHFADLHFRIARCAEAAGQIEAAHRHFGLARDWDALQFRADSRLNAMVRAVAAEQASRGVSLSDLERSLAESAEAEHGVPGHRLFHEHVHFTFAGDYEMARAWAPAVAQALGFTDAGGPWLTREACARALAFTPVDDLNVRTAMVRQTARPPFLDQLDHSTRQAQAEQQVQQQLSRMTAADFEQAATVYRDAIARSPDDWMFRFNYANLLSQFNHPQEAVREYEWVAKRFPRQRAFRLAYGNALLQAGRAVEALAQFNGILETDPAFQPARDARDAARRRLK